MSSLLTITFLSGLIIATLRMLPPLLLGATGEMFSERCGLTNIGLEGIMSVGAIIGFAASYFTQNPYLGMVAGVASGWAVNMIYAFLTINLNADQVIVGNAMNILGMALASLIYTTLSKSQGGLVKSVTADNYFVLIVSLVAVIVIWFYLYKTKGGLAFRSVGEFPRAAETLGVNIQKKKYLACSVNGMLSGLAGAYLTTVYITSYVSGIVSGRGYIALAAVIFGKWKPKSVLFACIFFAFLDALQLRLQVTGDAIPYQFLQMLPYLCTLIALSFFMKPGSEPKANGKPYVRESR
mgnify:FL=1